MAQQGVALKSILAKLKAAEKNTEQARREYKEAHRQDCAELLLLLDSGIASPNSKEIGDTVEKAFEGFFNASRELQALKAQYDAATKTSLSSPQQGEKLGMPSSSVTRFQNVMC